MSQIKTKFIQDSAISNAKLATDSVSTAKIQNSAVDNSKLATDSVSTAKIQNSAVDASKLATDSVTNAKIQNAAVDANKLASNSVTTAKIASNAVDGSKIRLANDEQLKARNAANSADVNILKVNADDKIEFASFPLTPSDPPAADYEVSNKKYVDDEIATAVADIEADLADYLPLAGGTMSGNINMNGNNLENAGQVQASTVNAYQISSDDSISAGNNFSVNGGSANFNGSSFQLSGGQGVDFGSNVITNVADPLADQDAATKKYVDDSISSADQDASEVSYDNSSSGMAAINVQDAIDELDGRLDSAESSISSAESDIDDLQALSGRPDGSVDLGTFTGSTIPDSQNNKQAFQALETAHESTDAKVGHLITLSGVASGADHLGTFTGTTIPDSSTVKAALQSLENAVEEVNQDAADAATLSGVAENSTSLGSFTGAIIPDASSVKGALQSLETFIEAMPHPFFYAGTYNATTNSPALANTDTGKNGYIYYVSVAGSQNFGAGSISFDAGDKVVNNGATWDKWDMTDAVSSVNGQSGAVSLALDDLSDVNASSPSSGDLLAWNGSEWVNQAAAASLVVIEEILTLNGTDITNQYKDLAHVAQGSSASVNSISMSVVGGPEQLKTVDYTISLTGGAGGNTRITFAGDLATGGPAALVSGDILLVKYSYSM